MASLFGHITASTALGHTFFPKLLNRPILIIAGVCSFIPDLDVIAFNFGVPYSSQWGHRGWTHSLTFACFLGFVAAFFYQRFYKAKFDLKLAWYFIISTASHPLLDMLTNGGKGCALWWPFSLERIFFPVRPILVSPMGVSSFFSQWGLEVLVSECFWIGFPALVMVVTSWWLRKPLSRNG